MVRDDKVEESGLEIGKNQENGEGCAYYRQFRYFEITLVCVHQLVTEVTDEKHNEIGNNEGSLHCHDQRFEFE